MSELPYSLEAEQSVLGAILLDSKCLDRVAEILPNSEYFNSANHKLIYSTIIDMFINGQPIDFVTVLNSIKKSADIDEESYRTYFLDLVNLVPSISNVETYAYIIRDKYNVRILAETAKEIIAEVSKNDLSSSELLDSAEQKIFDIRKGKEVKGLQRINEIILQTFDRLDTLVSSDTKGLSGISTGLSDLDRVIMGLNKSDLILLAARPGMGKTSFALNIAQHVALKEEKKVAFFSLEMTKEQLTSRILSMESMVQSQKLRLGNLNENEWERLIEAGDRLSKSQIYIDDTPAMTIPEMKSKLRRLNKVDLVLIDYLQLMSSAKRIDNRVQEISEITRNLKIMAKELDVPVVTLSQLSRASEQRADHRPVLSDLRDSGSIEQDADIVLFLYREGYYPSANVDENTNMNNGECIVAKNRHGETRSVPLFWQGEFMKFTAREETRVEY